MDEYQSTLTLYKLPVYLKRFLGLLLSYSYPRIAAVLQSLPCDTSDLREIYAEIMAFREQFVKLMKNQKLDALICPVQVGIIFLASLFLYRICTLTWNTFSSGTCAFSQ